MGKWTKWDRRFMEMVELVGTWSSCYRQGRQIGAVIVRNKRILTTGYNGAPEGYPSCKERGECLRDKLGIPSGTQAQFCYAVHAEQNAIAQAAKLGISLEDSTMYISHQPCTICSKLIINSGIKRVVYRYPYPDEFGSGILATCGIIVDRYDPDEAEE